MYYVIETEIKNASHVTLVRTGHEEDIIWVSGEQVDASQLTLPLEIVCEKKCDKLEDLLDVGLAYACSSRLKALMEQQKIDNLEFFPAIVRSKEGESKNYYVINIVGRLSFVDRDASDYTEYRGKIFRMNTMKTIESVAGLDIFRLDEYQEVVLISERLKKEIAGSNLTGIRLSPADGWGDQHRF